jgi:hypothetical protein
MQSPRELTNQDSKLTVSSTEIKSQDIPLTKKKTKPKNKTNGIFLENHIQ